MSEVVAARVTADMPERFVVFLIGMRVNKIWKVWKWWPVISAMPIMIRELYARPSLGFLGHHTWFGRTMIVLQYWRSYDDLEAYSRNRDQSHLPAWGRFNRSIGSNGDVGIWHETYVIEPENYECIYNNMPRFGLGGVAGLKDAVGRRFSARGRMARASRASDADSAPADQD